jgi:hypothetical protein
MTKQRAETLKPRPAKIPLIALLAVLCFSGTSYAAQKVRSNTAARTSRAVELVNIEQLKQIFERDAGNVRLVALVSPT